MFDLFKLFASSPTPEMTLGHLLLTMSLVAFSGLLPRILSLLPMSQKRSVLANRVLSRGITSILWGLIPRVLPTRFSQFV